MRKGSQPILAFSWGYEGWGNYTSQLVEASDAMEKSRGFNPPMFIDVRLRRMVRAPGFRERAFEKLLGSERYRWMPGLGNRAILDEDPDGIEIDRPEDADNLLDEIVAADRAGSRAIFFCSCGCPKLVEECHRLTVGKLVLRRATARKISLAIHEWPGGSPIVTSLPLSPNEMKRALTGGLKNVSLPPAVDIAWAAALPHFSLISSPESDGAAIVSGPARCTSRGWVLPVYSSTPAPKLRVMQRVLDADLKEFNLAPQGAKLELPPRWRSESPP
jgi:hypothetical protein